MIIAVQSCLLQGLFENQKHNRKIPREGLLYLLDSGLVSAAVGQTPLRVHSNFPRLSASRVDV